MKRFLVEDDVIDNEKVAELTPESFRFWMFCLCIANRQDPRGSLPSVKSIAFRCRMAEKDASMLVEELVSVRLIDRSKTGQLRMHDWECHQHVDRDWAAIKRAQRAKKKALSSGQEKDNSEDVHVDMSRTSPQDMSNMSTGCPPIKEGSKKVSPSEIASESTQKQSHSVDTASDDVDDPPIELDGPVGVNSAKDVRETLFTAESLYPLTNVRILAREWLKETTAARVIAALHATASREPIVKRPAPYVKTLLDDPSFPQARKNGPPSKPHKAPIVLECERMFINPNRPKPETKP